MVVGGMQGGPSVYHSLHALSPTAAVASRNPTPPGKFLSRNYQGRKFCGLKINTISKLEINLYRNP